MFLRRIQRHRHPREEISIPDRLRLLLHAWRDASDRNDTRMADRAWSALNDDAAAAEAHEVVEAVALVEQHRRAAGAWSPELTTLQFAVARFAAAGDPALAARFVIQDLSMAAASDFRASRDAHYLAKLGAVRAMADRIGLDEVSNEVDALVADHQRTAALRADLLRNGTGDPEGILDRMARDHEDRLAALVAMAWPERPATRLPVNAGRQAGPLRRPRAAGSPPPPR